MKIIEAPMIGGTYPATASVSLEVSAGRRDFSVLAPAVTEALQAVGLSARVGDGFLTIAGRHEAQLPAYRMDEEIWCELKSHGYKLGDVTPIAVRNVFSGGQHGRNQARMYMYEGLSLFVAKGVGGQMLLSTVGEYARAHPSGPPDFDQIVQCLIEPKYESQRWAPLMSNARGFVGRALFTGQGVPDITYFADSMVAIVEGDGAVEPVFLPNADGKPRFVATWAELIRS